MSECRAVLPSRLSSFLCYKGLVDSLALKRQVAQILALLMLFRLGRHLFLEIPTQRFCEGLNCCVHVLSYLRLRLEESVPRRFFAKEPKALITVELKQSSGMLVCQNLKETKSGAVLSLALLLLIVVVDYPVD